MATQPKAESITDAFPDIRTNMIVYIVEGCVILIANIPLVLIILFLQRLRERKEFLFIAGLSLGDLVYTVGHMLASTRRLIAVDSREQMFTTRASCMQSVNLAFFYGNGVVVPFLGSAVLTGLNYFLVVRYDPNELVLSLCFDQIYPGLEIVVMLHRCGCVVLSVFVYIVVIALLYKKFVRDFAINTRTKALNKCQRKNVIDATLTMGLSTLNTVLFMLIPDLSLYFFLISAPTTYLVLNSLILNKVMFNFVLFLARHREFRRLFCDMVQSKRKNVIRNAGRVRGADRHPFAMDHVWTSRRVTTQTPTQHTSVNTVNSL
ncbi:hypothetical protein Q1695_007329 [Nippostrongylus brasiliensis]|nr:hypothetical protein Q1695_007329 [Nippostrongylus brasiliensis]